ncbi:MAG TPA: hypothetical protein VIU62_19980, partial [Chloroflexota bacterium]
MSPTPAEATRSRAATRLTPVYLLCFVPGCLVLIYWVFGYCQRSWSVLSFPYGYDYGEAPELNRAIAVAHLQPFYPFWSTPPYQMANYTPLYSVLNGLFVRFLGVQFQSGRAIAWVCGLLFCAGLAWLAWREGRTWLAPLVTALLWFSSNYVWNWTPLGREDELAMLFSLGGMIVFFEGTIRATGARLPLGTGSDVGQSRLVAWSRRVGEHRHVWLATALFLAAIFTRQTTIEAAAACALYLLVRQRRLGVAFIIVFTLAAGLIFASIDALSRGAFYLNIVTGNRNLYHWQRVVFQVHQFWNYYQAAALLAALYVVAQLVTRRQQLFVLWLLLTFAVALTAGKEGASDNYLLLPWGSTSLLVGLAVGRLLAWSVWLWGRRLPFVLATRPAALLLPVLTGTMLLLHAQLTFHLPYQGQFDRSTIDFVGRQGVNGLLRRWTDTGWYLRLLPGELPPSVLE